MTIPHARITDPISSERAVAAIAVNDTLKEHILYAAKRLHPVYFDDTDLLELVEEQTERRQQRNVIARSRGLMERDGIFDRVGMIRRIDPNRETVHFCIAGQRDQAQLTIDDVGDVHGYEEGTPEWTT